jgi:cystathionine gamma-synthase
MTLKAQVLSQQAPGDRCTLYAGYADASARHLEACVDVTFSDRRDAHGDGFPSLWLNDTPVQPCDGVIIMPANIVPTLSACGVAAEILNGLAEALEEPMERKLEAGQEP